MKKTIVCLLSLLLICSLFAACGKNGGDTAPAPVNSDDLPFKTIGEALEETENRGESVQSAIYEKPSYTYLKRTARSGV